MDGRTDETAETVDAGQRAGVHTQARSDSAARSDGTMLPVSARKGRHPARDPVLKLLDRRARWNGTGVSRRGPLKVFQILLFVFCWV